MHNALPTASAPGRSRGTCRRIPRRWLVLLLLVAGGTASGAAAPGAGAADSAAVRVSWPDIARIIDRHPLLAAAASDERAARGAVRAAGAIPNPTFEGSWADARPKEGGGSGTERDLSITIPLDWMVQRGARVHAARATAEAAAADRENLRRAVLARMQRLFWTVAYDQEKVATWEALASQTDNILGTVRSRVAKGDARPIEQLRWEIEAARVASELASARAAFEGGRARLALRLGLAEPGALTVDATLTELPGLPELDALIERLATTHPALRAEEARIRAARAETGAEKRARFPSLEVTGFTTEELDQRAAGGGLAVAVPLWNWNSGRIAQAEANLSAAEQRREAATLDLAEELIEAHAACRASEGTAVRLQSEIVPRSEKAAALAERAYQLGEASLLEVIESRRTLLESRRLLLEALLQARIDYSRLTETAGEELP